MDYRTRAAYFGHGMKIYIRIKNMQEKKGLLLDKVGIFNENKFNKIF
jgi:hypothetical protein